MEQGKYLSLMIFNFLKYVVDRIKLWIKIYSTT